tara:strand:- start:897 stop:1226 length:330 start_codon:yes stop_codon:yes gene_type:complete
MKFSELKTVDLNTREWFDRTYGNTYFAGELTLNSGMDSEQSFCLPFQYGYGGHSETVAAECLSRVFRRTKWAKELRPLWKLKEIGIVLRTNRETGCTKRECKELEFLSY